VAGGAAPYPENVITVNDAVVLIQRVVQHRPWIPVDEPSVPLDESDKGPSARSYSISYSAHGCHTSKRAQEAHA
jgi:hypothetical protein